MKVLCKIVGRVLLGLLLTVYVAVALLNYSLVQSYVGAAAGQYFSREWGGEVHIGAMHAMPWNHLILNNVRIVAPDGDTLLNVESLRVSFHRFPLKDGGLQVDRVSLRNGYYHFSSHIEEGHPLPVTNLQYIIDYYSHGEPPLPPEAAFPVDVGALNLRHVHYKMDLPDVREVVYDEGVEIPHMEFYDISGRIKDIHVVNDDVTCHIIRLSTRERSGFVVDNIKGEVHVSPHDITVRNLHVRTPKSDIQLDSRMTYDGWEVMEDYLNTVYHEVTIKEGTTVALSDVAYWAPVLWGIETQVEASGMAQGTINEMTTDLSLHWGEHSGLLVAGQLHDITEIDSAQVNVDIERLWTNYSDLQPALSVLPIDKKILQIAKEVDYIDAGLRLRGGLSQATTANLALLCSWGNLRADASLRPTDHGGIGFDIEAGSSGLQLQLLQSEWFTRTGFTASASGIWRDMKDINSLSATLQGELTNSVVRGQRLAPVDIEGKMTRGRGEVTLLSADSLAQIALSTRFDLADSVKDIIADLNIAHLDATAFKLLPEKYGNVKTHAALTFNGRDADEIDGRLTMQGTEMGTFKVNHLTLNVEANNGSKTLQLRSDPVDATVSGRFDYGDLPLMLRQMGSTVLPEDLAAIEPLSDEELAAIEKKQLNLHLLWKDDGRFLQGVNENLALSKGTRIDGSYNTSELMKLVLRSDSVRMGSVLVENIGLSSHASGRDYVVEIEAEELNIGTLELLRRADITLNSNRQRALMDVSWGDDDASSSGDLRLRLRDGMIGVMRPDFRIGETDWKLLIDSLRLNTLDGFSLTGDHIALLSDEQSVSARLSLQQRPNDCVELTFDHFSLDGLADIVLRESPIALAGNIDGRFSMYGLNEIPYFNANLQVDSCAINQYPLGDLRLHSHWNAELNMLNLDVAGNQIDATGWLELGKQDPDISFNVTFDSFELGLVEPLLSDFANRFEGRLHGNFDISGSTSHPLIEGEAYVEDGALGIGITGVTYYFTDSIRFNDRMIMLDGFKVRDPRNNIALIDGAIHYNELTDITLDLSLRTDNLLVLDRRQGEEFYGTLLASAEGTVKGKIDSLNVNVSARTNPGSKLTVPVSDQRQVKAHNYITFVSDEPQTTVKKATAQQDQHMNIELDLAITPDAQLNLPMDFSDVTVKVSATGAGDMHLSLAGQEEPQVLGSYEIISGTMRLGILSLIEKNFSLESGSNLSFQGNLPDARFDLRAVYSQRVNLSTLTGSSNDVGSTQKYLQVEDVIAIAGTLQEPTINFDIRLPNADASVEEEVFAYIDRNSERDMLNQTVSLLVLGQFYNANTSALNGNIATSGGIGALSGLLSDLVGVVDINVDYKAANELTKDQLDVNISKDWGRW